MVAVGWKLSDLEKRITLMVTNNPNKVIQNSSYSQDLTKMSLESCSDISRVSTTLAPAGCQEIELQQSICERHSPTVMLGAVVRGVIEKTLRVVERHGSRCWQHPRA